MNETSQINSHTNLIKTTQDLQIIINHTSKEELEMLFGFLCGEGPVSFLEYILNNSVINIHSYQEFPFRQACKYGKNYIAHRLWDLAEVNHREIDITVLDHYPVRKTCRHGNILLLKWLLAKYKLPNKSIVRYHIEISARKYYALRYICKKGYYPILRHIIDYALNNKIKLNLNFSNDLLFKIACENGHLQIAILIFSVSPVNIGNCLVDCLRLARINRHIEVLSWLLTL
jgi:hypothetical protein